MKTRRFVNVCEFRVSSLSVMSGVSPGVVLNVNQSEKKYLMTI